MCVWRGDEECEGLKWVIYNKPELKSVSFAIRSLIYSSKVNLIFKARPPSSSEVCLRPRNPKTHSKNSQ